METDNWKDVFQELRDFSPVPPESVKAAIDQQLAAGATQTVGRSLKWVIYLSGFLLLVVTTIGAYYYFNTENSDAKKFTENSSNSSSDIDKANEMNLREDDKTEVKTINSTSDSGIFSKNQTNRKEKNNLIKSKSLSLRSQTIENQNKNNSTNPSKVSVSGKNKTSNTSQKNGKSSTTSFVSKSLDSDKNKTNKQISYQKSRVKKNNKVVENKSKIAQGKVGQSTTAPTKQIETSYNASTTAENKSTNDVAKTEEKQKDNNLLQSNSSNGLNQTSKNNSAAIDSNLLAENVVKNDLEKDRIEADKKADENTKGKSANNLNDNKGNKNFKNEFGLAVGPMLTSNKRATNSPEIQLQSKVGIQLNAHYGYKISDRFTINAGLSYQNYKEKLSQNSPAKTDSVITSYTTVIIPNPVDTTIMDTIVTPVYSVQNTPAINGSNEIRLNRFGLNTGLSFLVYENQAKNWSYNVRFGHQLFYSQSRTIQTEAPGYPATVGTWNGAVYIDNYLSKNIGMLNVTLGLSSTYDYTRLTNWSEIEKKRLYFSPFIGFSMQF